MSPLSEDSDLIVIVRLVRAILLVMMNLATLAVTVAMFWRDVGVDSFFDDWFGQWSEAKLTVVAGAMGVASIVALRITQKSERRNRQRSHTR